MCVYTCIHLHRREQKSCEFNLYEAYAIDLIVSTGEGRTKPIDTRTTVFRKTEEIYQLKMKASRGIACLLPTSSPFIPSTCYYTHILLFLTVCVSLMQHFIVKLAANLQSCHFH